MVMFMFVCKQPDISSAHNNKTSALKLAFGIKWQIILLSL